MLEDFWKDYLLLNVSDYFDSGIDFPINIFLLSIAIGLCVASVIITFHKRYIAYLVKQLLRFEAIGEERAKTLNEVRIKPSYTLRSSLQKESGQLANIIKRAGAKKYTYEEYLALQKKKGYKEEKIDFNEAKFYIDTDKIIYAKKINEDGIPSYFQSVLSCVLILSLFICVSLFMPEILTFLGNIA